VRAAALRRVEREAAGDLEQAAWAWQRRLERRGQALAEHQLQLLEELVRGEPDPTAAACSGSTGSPTVCAAPPGPCSP
jgi:hypothetical protein